MILKRVIEYPESDGKPLAESTLQAFWILVIYGNLLALFRNRPDVFVAADNLWYPREGEDKLCQGPDVYVVFGRPKGHRGSYKQWEEDDIPLTVVFEILSKSDDVWEMARKLQFYDEHGVEEYYVYDPERNRLMAYVRGRAALRLHDVVESWTSPRLGIRFDLSDEGMRAFYPNGQPFLSFEDLKELQERESERAENESQRADDAEQRAENESQRADDAESRFARLALLGRRARLRTASADELAELERLEGETGAA